MKTANKSRIFFRIILCYLGVKVRKIVIFIILENDANFID